MGNISLLWELSPKAVFGFFAISLLGNQNKPIERAAHILTGSRDELFVKLISHDRFGKIPETNEGDHSFGGRSNQALDSWFYEY